MAASYIFVLKNA